MNAERRAEVDTFYRHLAILLARQPARLMATASGRDPWPARGVYFFFEPGETRADGTPRVVRIGTHALKDGSQSSLWGRLQQHRGTLAPKGGNHRGSIFRRLVGAALQARSGQHVASWGEGVVGTPAQLAAEVALEEQVSDHVGAMQVAWLDISDAPGAGSLRGYVERNAIALLSGQEPPSGDWLGAASDRARVRRSGLWNSNHVDDVFDPAFNETFAALVKGAAPAARARGNLVIQCAKSKQAGGWFRDEDGTELAFVADPSLAPVVPGVRAVHPEDTDRSGRSWRQRVLDYDARFRATGENPFGLHPAAQLYAHRAYGALAASRPASRFYILSACWGLVRSDMLLPNYDVTFSRTSGAPVWTLRSGDAGWQDLCMLDKADTEALIFIGGRRYLPAFARLSQGYAGRCLAYYNATEAPELPGVELRRFETATRTNWHYELALKLGGGAEIGALRAGPSEEPRRSPPGVPRAALSHGKYTPLHRHLSSLPPEQRAETLSFARLEALLGGPLPASARKHQAWWSNGGGHPQAAAWMDADFVQAAHSFSAAWVRFERAR